MRSDKTPPRTAPTVPPNIKKMPNKKLYALAVKPLSFTAHKTSKLPAPNGIWRKILPIIANVKHLEL